MLEVHGKRILSGIQPSGVLHIGNYFGAIRQHIALQEDNQCYYFVANYHAMTTIHDKDELTQNTLMVALDYLALGLNPQKAVLFVQSDVPEVTELAWMLSTITPMGLLERAHAYKDKLAKGISPNHGLFAYPVLMAADILIYDSHLVPVGKDQKQHVEMTRDMAEKFNSLYGEVLTIPDALILPEVAVVPGIDGQKMSKSYGNTIEIFCDYKTLKSRVMSIVTDSTPLEAPKDPDNSTIIDLYKLFASAEEVEAMRQKFLAGGYGYGHAKKELLEKIWNYFEPYRKKREELAANMDYVHQVLREGAFKARESAEQVMDRVRKAAGVVRHISFDKAFM
ncbi:MAG: tryptophan--tRNA ligase [Calditrichaeota bacterium]|nr:MAG: tryptophan--tRNA ligase [Calditrichota bacterium]